MTDLKMDIGGLRTSRRGFLGTAMIAAAAPIATAGAQGAGTPATPPVLQARTARKHLLPDTDTQLLAFNDAVPGPLLRLKRGQPLQVKLANALAHPLSLHWRGMRIANALDGIVPLTGEPLSAGASRTVQFVPPDAGLFMYHPHGPGAAEMFARGLGGLVIVEEDHPPETDREYVFAIGDWKLQADGRFDGQPGGRADRTGMGRIGTVVTVNGKAVSGHGKARPLTIEAPPGARLRLRMANMAPARIMALTFEGAPPALSAIDGQPCEPFQPLKNTVPVGPGGRFEVFCEMPHETGKSVRIMMRSWPAPGEKPHPPLELVRLTAAGTPLPARPPLQWPGANPKLPAKIRLQDALRRTLQIGYGRESKSQASQPTPWSINGKPGSLESDSPLFRVERGRPVSLAFRNASRFPQVMRLHGHVMRELHPLDDGWQPYWRDNVLVPPGGTTRVAFIADNPGRWHVGSANLAHMEGGLATWFEVT